MKLFFVLLLISNFSWAKPQSVEVWFLSADSLTQLIAPRFSISNKLASNDCIPMGEGCFHPQLGYIEENPSSKPVESTDRTIPDDGVDLIECDDKDYFNIFCQKNRPTEHYPRLEVWIDYSSSLRVLDPINKEGGCHRSNFIRELQKGCASDRIGFSIFNTAIKELAVAEDVCTNYGTNNSKKLKKWIEGSSVKKLIVITDIDEHTREFKEYLDSIGADIKGVDFGSITPASLQGKISGIVSLCKKIKPITK